MSVGSPCFMSCLISYDKLNFEILFYILYLLNCFLVEGFDLTLEEQIVAKSSDMCATVVMEIY